MSYSGSGPSFGLLIFFWKVTTSSTGYVSNFILFNYRKISHGNIQFS